MPRQRDEIDEKLAELGFVPSEDEGARVTFGGPRGAAAARKLTEEPVEQASGDQRVEKGPGA